MKGEEDWEVKIGGDTPPIKTDDGWFLLYHGVDANFTYRVGAALLDHKKDDEVTAIGPTGREIKMTILKIEH